MQKPFDGRAPPRPTGGAYSTPPDLLAEFAGAVSRQGGGKGRARKKREDGREKRREGRKGREGGKKKRRGGKGASPGAFGRGAH